MKRLLLILPIFLCLCFLDFRQRDFDEAIKLANQAVDLAEKYQKQRDSLMRELEQCWINYAMKK